MRTNGILGLLMATLAQMPVIVKGRVIDDRTDPVDNALVEVTSPTTGAVVSVRSNKAGEYVLRMPSAAEHLDVMVRRIGFRPARFSLENRGPDAAVIGNVQLFPVAPITL